MATKESKSSSTKSGSPLRASLLAGSEETFDFCQPCSTENLHLEAVGFCQTCDEYLCDTCYKCHRKTTATRHHILLEKADMPKNKVATKPTDDLKETCPKHQNMLLEYCCNSHNELCCVVCLKTDHGSCKFTSHIQYVSDGIDSSDEYKNLMIDLKVMVSSVTKQQHIINLSTEDNDKSQSQSLAGIRDFRKEVDKLMDKYEENSVMKVSELHHANSEKIKAASSECQGVLSDVTAMIANLDAKAKCGKQNQLFVDIKMSRQRLSAMEAESSDVTDCSLTRYRFLQDEKIKEVMSTLFAVWSLSIRQDGKETKARYLGEVNVKSEDDTNDCTIDGIAVLPGGDIVVTDGKNKSLKLVDMKLSKITSSISLSSPPFDITSTKPNEVAVSLENDEKIEIYTVTDALALSNTIHVGEGDFCGMCYDGERFILTYENTSLIKLVDMSGRVLSTISTDVKGDRLFTKPRNIAVGRYSDVVYVTDYEAHTVTTMTLDGHVISVYRNDRLKTPRGVTVGPDKKVYVCSGGTHSVLQLTATGEFQQILLDEQRGLSRYPDVIAYDDISDRLYISSGSNKPDHRNYVKLFQVE